MNDTDKSREEVIQELLILRKEHESLKILYNDDIAALKLAEEELEENKEKYRGLSEAAFESIFISEKGLCIEQNQTAEKVFGYTNQEAIGRYGTEWIIPENRDMVMQNMLDGYEQPYEVTALRKDGSKFPCMLRGKMMHYKGRIVRVTSLSDITDRKRVEEELIIEKEHAEESDRLKSAFLANMSHEIRTPMNGILGFAGLLKHPKLSGEEQKQYISIIENSGLRMLNIINNIIDISKIEAGLMKLDIKDSNINDQLEYLFAFFKPEVEGKGMKISYTCSLSGIEARISTDREKLYAILTNLIKNAIKYSDHGVIEFGYRLKESQSEINFTRITELEFFVKDNGIGIATDRQAAIFERFIQADIADTHAFQGAGLGLSISKAFVEMLGGNIRVESEDGKGSVFYFTIPYIQGNTENNEIEVSTQTFNEVNSVKNLKILIAEDDETSVLFMVNVLKEYGREILTVNNGIDAVEMYRRNPDIDLILMDIKMNNMDGYEATRQIRSFDKDVVIIAQTAHGLSSEKSKAADSGCTDYISKPLDLIALDGLVQKYFKK